MLKRLVLTGTTMALVYSCATRKFGDQHQNGANADLHKLYYENSLTSGSQIGLQKKEVALTLDDGPVPETLDLAKWLLKEEVPVAFFFVGKNAQAYPNIVKQISEMKFSTGPMAGQHAFIIANHSWSHKRKFNSISCIVCDGVDYAIQEIQKADDVLKPYIKAQNKPYLFRAPGGNFFRSNISQEVQDLATVNQHYSKYIGPFWWDVDGDVNPGPCQSGWKSCLNSYVSNTVSVGNSHGVIVLAHDVSSLTRQMLRGDSSTPGYIAQMKSAGFKFVAMDKYPDALSKFGDVPANEFGNPKLVATKVGAATYSFAIDVPTAARIDVHVNGLATPLFSGVGSHLDAQQKFSSTGNRVFKVRGFDAQNKLIAYGVRTVFIEP